MQWFNYVVEANKSLQTSKLRTRITIIIIALGITALVGIVTAISAIESSIRSNFSLLGSNTLSIRKEGVFRKQNGGKTKSPNKAINYRETQAFKEQYAYPSTVGVQVSCNQNGLVKSTLEKSDPNILVRAVDENFIKITNNNIWQGRFFTPTELQGTVDVCLLGFELAKTIFKQQPIRALNQLIFIDNKKYAVVGVLKEKGISLVDKTDNAVFITINSGRKNFDLSNATYGISIKVNNINELDIAKEEAEGTMRIVRMLPTIMASNFVVEKNSAIVQTVIDNSRKVTVAAVFIGLITLLGAAISLMNIMLVAVVERTKEVGLSKALGATNKVVVNQFLAESILVSIKGGIWGIVFGIAIGNIISIIFKSAFVVPWMWLIAAIVMCIVVGVLAGIYPALKAGKLNPIQALRFE